MLKEVDIPGDVNNSHMLSVIELKMCADDRLPFKWLKLILALIIFRFPLQTISFEMQRAYPKRTGRFEVFSVLRDKSFLLRTDVTA